jgi:hypothetical protein
MQLQAKAELGQFPSVTPAFNTARFMVTPLNPAKLRSLVEILLQDEQLATHLPWMVDKSLDGARHEAFLIELQASTGTTKGWGIVERERRMFIGAVLARQCLSGIDVEVLCPSQFWDQGVSDEVGPPLAEWLEENIEIDLVFRQ